MSDADGGSNGGGDPRAESESGTRAGAESADDFDPVWVFGGDAGEMDLRSGSDDCYKCSTCDANCPVAEVDADFPGPKFQGPEQWRLRRSSDADVDPSVMSCSNCMRCDDACPTGVPLSQMHNTARAAYVEESSGLLPSRRAVRNRLLANYGRLARVASRVPRLANAVANNRLARWAGERLLGITAERAFPPFATQTFREWFRERGGPAVESAEKRVAYFHGDYANHNTTEVAKALVRVYEHFGYEVRVPEQRCSGTPMFANGRLDDARRAARVNVASLGDLVAEGYDVVCSCTSCSMALRKEYPELFALEGVETVAANTYDALEYLRHEEDLAGALADARHGGDDAGDLADAEAAAFAYHAPCHARNQGLAGQTPEVLGGLEGVDVTDVGDSCSGISGTYGWKAEKYETSMAIGEEMFAEMAEAPGETGLTECPTCAMQMEHGSGDPVRHPLEVVAAALLEGDRPA